MNILIVGNGFDLSHYLPTKYEHFMGVMNEIETHTSQTMSFDELFSKYHEDYFISKTKAYYSIDDISIDKELLVEIQTLLKNNHWYQYFKSNLGINTWIDFENEILNVLQDFAKLIPVLEEFSQNEFLLNNLSQKSELINSKSSLYKRLQSFDLFIKKAQRPNQAYEYIFFNEKFCLGSNLRNGVNSAGIISFLHEKLDEFIEIFNQYLNLIVSKLRCKCIPDIKLKSWIEPDKIFSFNYTNTYQRLYGAIEGDYLHGSHGESQNIVLGISDLENESLKRLKAYGFTKYHQKLLKKTDYHFLHRLKREISETKEYIDECADRLKNDKNLDFEVQAGNAERFHEARRKLKKLQGTIYIWGHSLDISDANYVREIFGFNEDKQDYIIIIFFHNRKANFDLLANLIHILGNEKVEQWMKNGWLKFEPNPEIDFGIEQQTIEKEAS